MISRANKPLAVLISVAEYEEKVLKSDRGRKLRDVVAGMEAWRLAHRGKTAGIDAAQAVRELRDRR
jgi:PHD/YefM family antitoxin component YafN of YafNO toxin-antitoxin module